MIPEFEHFILPTLTVLSNGDLLSLDDIRSGVVRHFGFTQDELSETTRSGNNTKVNDRTTWALTYLRQAGLAESPKRAFAQITFAGLELLEEHPTLITRDFLYQKYPSFRDFQNRSRGKKSKNTDPETKTPAQDTSGAKNSEPLLFQNLIALRSAIESFRKVGIEPTTEQLEKLSELESSILAKIIAENISKSLIDNLLEVSDKFVINMKYNKHRLFLHVDTSDDAMLSFPENKSIEINPTRSQTENNHPKRKRRPNLNFFDMGLITGDKLYYKDDDIVTVTIASENKVEYNGQLYSLTKLTQELKGLAHAIQPTSEWIFDGQNLLDLYNETYSSKDE